MTELTNIPRKITTNELTEAAELMRRLLEQQPSPHKLTPKATGAQALSQQARRRREAEAAS